VIGGAKGFQVQILAGHHFSAVGLIECDRFSDLVLHCRSTSITTQFRLSKTSFPHALAVLGRFLSSIFLTLEFVSIRIAVAWSLRMVGARPQGPRHSLSADG
jgi:hypothetical protein